MVLRHGEDAVKDAGIATMGYPGTWAETKVEIKQIIKEIEK